MNIVVSGSLRRVLIKRPFSSRHFHRTAAWASQKVVQPFKLADIGEGITECEIIKWSVKVSDTVQAFDPLCEVQSDKASVELTSPFDGIVKELLVKEGDVAKVGSNLCFIEVAKEDGAEVEEEVKLIETSESVAGPSQTIPESPTPSKTEKKGKPHPMDPRSEPRPEITRNADVLALPSVRHFAKVNNVDLTLVAPGSGRNGRIEKRDIENFLAQSSGTGSQPSATRLEMPSRAADQQGDVVVDLGRTRYNMWKAMVKSLEIPHFGYSTYLDLTKLNAMLPLLSNNIPAHYLSTSTPQKPLAVNPSAVYPAPEPGTVAETAKYSRLTFLPVLLKSLSRAMEEWPLFRSSITPGSDAADSGKPTLTVRPHADISIALSTPSGLYTPTIQRVNTHSVYSLASEIAHVAALGRRTPCGLTPAEMPRRGGTITVSNVGAIGAGEFASPVLVPGGGVAIVAIGRAKWVRDEELDGERRLKVGISWSADHRVVEGAELAAFVECWRSWIEHPERMIAAGV